MQMHQNYDKTVIRNVLYRYMVLQDVSGADICMYLGLKFTTVRGAHTKFKPICRHFGFNKRFSNIRPSAYGRIDPNKLLRYVEKYWNKAATTEDLLAYFPEIRADYYNALNHTPGESSGSGRKKSSGTRNNGHSYNTDLDDFDYDDFDDDEQYEDESYEEESYENSSDTDDMTFAGLYGNSTQNSSSGYSSSGYSGSGNGNHGFSSAGYSASGSDSISYGGSYGGGYSGGGSYGGGYSRGFGGGSYGGSDLKSGIIGIVIICVIAFVLYKIGVLGFLFRFAAGILSFFGRLLGSFSDILGLLILLFGVFSCVACLLHGRILAGIMFVVSCLLLGTALHGLLLGEFAVGLFALVIGVILFLVARRI